QPTAEAIATTANPPRATRRARRNAMFFLMANQITGYLRISSQSGLRVNTRFHGRMRRAIDAANVLHEQLLRQPVGFVHEGIMVSLSYFADLVEPRVTQGFSGFAERLESVFRLTG